MHGFPAAAGTRGETMTLCANCSNAVGCADDPDAATYHPPVGGCFSPPKLWPGDQSWGEFDVRDTCVVLSLAADEEVEVVTGAKPQLGDWGRGDGASAARNEHAVANSGLKREFFGTTNGTCAGEPTDSFDLPLGVCVGPFGKPRPWGVFTCENEEAAARAGLASE